MHNRKITKIATCKCSFDGAPRKQTVNLSSDFAVVVKIPLQSALFNLLLSVSLFLKQMQIKLWQCFFACSSIGTQKGGRVLRFLDLMCRLNQLRLIVSFICYFVVAYFKHNSVQLIGTLRQSLLTVNHSVKVRKIKQNCSVRCEQT